MLYPCRFGFWPPPIPQDQPVTQHPVCSYVIDVCHLAPRLTVASPAPASEARVIAHWESQLKPQRQPGLSSVNYVTSFISHAVESMTVTPKTPEQIEGMRVAGRLAAEVLEMIAPMIDVGMTTGEIDRICHDYIVNVQKAIPAPLNYHGFPRSICTSINDVICHGIPSDSKKLKNGDIINIDVTVIKEGWHGDTSIMVGVGDVPQHAERLMLITQECLYKALAIVKPGTTLGDIGHIIQEHAESNYYSVVREYCGHGIGQIFHDEPQVLHYGKPGTGLVLEPGMTFTIEPMINAGKRHTKLNTKDGWTVTTRDGRLSAQWEHTIAVTDTGCDVLTRRSDEQLPC